METMKEGEDKVLPSSAQLPFSLSEAVKIGEGSTSIVYKVAIGPGHLQYKYFNIRDPDVGLLSFLFLLLIQQLIIFSGVQTVAAADCREAIQQWLYWRI